MPTPAERFKRAAEKAGVLAEALPWLQRFHDRIVVVKYGGHAMVDDELKRAYAAEHPGTPHLPRVLLIVDEFQEFFIEDDKLAQEAALLLDRLVRQGRAFGIHVLLGSQTRDGRQAVALIVDDEAGVRNGATITEQPAWPNSGYCWRNRASVLS